MGGLKIDFATFDARDPFESTDAHLEYSVYRQRVQVMDVEGVRVAMPDRSTLLLSKLKAAWDRQVRLDEGRPSNAMWERGKLVKDRADILALVDPSMGGEEIDIASLGRSFDRYPFLVTALDRAGADLDGIEKYGITGSEDARRAVDLLIGLTSG